MKRTASLLVLAAALASQGCSFFFTRAPEPMARTGVPCNTSEAPAWLDVGGAVSGGLLALALTAEPDDEYQGTDYGMSAVMGATGLISGIAHTAAALYGFSQVNACKKLRAAEMARMRQPPPPAWVTPSTPAPAPPEIDVEVRTDVIIRPR